MSSSPPPDASIPQLPPRTLAELTIDYEVVPLLAPQDILKYGAFVYRLTETYAYVATTSDHLRDPELTAHVKHLTGRPMAQTVEVTRQTLEPFLQAARAFAAEAGIPTVATQTPVETGRLRKDGDWGASLVAFLTLAAGLLRDDSFARLRLEHQSTGLPAFITAALEQLLFDLPPMRPEQCEPMALALLPDQIRQLRGPLAAVNWEDTAALGNIRDQIRALLATDILGVPLE